MALSERAVRLEAMAERLSKALGAEIKRARAMGEHQLEGRLARTAAALQADLRERVGAIEGGLRKPRGVEEWGEHVRALRAHYAAMGKPPVRVQLAKQSVRRLRQEATRDEVLDAG
jgi:hypothetical protein